MISQRRFPLVTLLVFSMSLTLYAQTPGDDASAAGLHTTEVIPTVADPELKTEFNDANLVVVPSARTRRELVVFFPGTHGRPRENTTIIDTIAAGGYRVVGLMYDDAPIGELKCRVNDSKTCLGSFREERVNGDAPEALEQNTVRESIVFRLTKLLQYEARANPGAGWEAYLDGDQPKWSNIIVTGHSQGSGMAAYVAKQHEVARVVLFSGPSDGVGLRAGMDAKDVQLSAWLAGPSKTPPDRWYASYHDKEVVNTLSPMEYAALGVPPDHITVFTLEPPANSHATGKLAYHMAVVNDPRYQPQWRKMFGIVPSK